MAYRPKKDGVRLSVTQVKYLRLFSAGQRQSEIAAAHGVTPASVNGSLLSASYKLKVHTVTQAAAVWARYEALISCAKVLESGVIAEPAGEAEDHLNRVLSDYAAEFRALARRLVP